MQKRINKMNGYTKMKKSIIIKESSSPPSDSHNHDPQHSKNDEETKNDHTSALTNENKPPSSGGAPKFQRISSVSSSRPTMAIQTSSVRQTFSVRRSRSVSDRYCRIHDQHLVISPSSLINDGGDEGGSKDDGSDDIGSDMKEKKNGNGGKRILKACKRIFRF